MKFSSANSHENTQGQALERLAFTFCKIATLCLICGPYALPVAASSAAFFFAFAYFKGQKQTRCLGKHPLLIAAFWLLVTGIWMWRKFGI